MCHDCLNNLLKISRQQKRLHRQETQQELKTGTALVRYKIALGEDLNKPRITIGQGSGVSRDVIPTHTQYSMRSKFKVKSGAIVAHVTTHSTGVYVRGK